MLGSTAGPAGGNSHRGLWPLAPAPAPPAPHLTAEGYSRYGVYSLFPGAGSPAPGVGVGAALYSHTSTIGRFAPGHAATPGQSSATTFHAAHKVTDSLFSTSNYTFGAPTPPPGSPYSPIPVAQLELLAKGITCSVSSVVQSNSSLSTTLKKSHSLSNTSDDKHPVRSLCEERCWVKSEKRSASSSSCGCQPTTASPSKTTKFTDNSSGCSRTNPVEWSPVSVKREPGATPCQVAEVTTSDVGSTSVVKVEATSPTSTARNSLPTPPTQQHKQELPQVSVPQSISNSNIPVGIAVARQRLHQDLTPSPSFIPPGLLAPIAPIQPIKEISSRISEIDTAPGMAATAATMGGATGGAILHCGDDRATGLATWPIGGAHGSALATPTLWQYPAHMPIEPMLPLPVPMPPVGVQLVRDPTSGHFLLIPTASLEQLQQAVVWPSYPQPSSHMLLPPLHPPPLAPLQLLSSASSDYLATSTTLHQHTQTHSTRLVAVTTDTKRKVPLPLPAHTLIKIEADCTATSTLDQTKAVQQTVSTVSSNTGTVFTDPSVTPLVTTHVFYQHPTNLILSQAPSTETPCKSQATSPVTCLTPPPEVLPAHEEENSLSVQDASNQTDTNIFVEEEQLIVAPEVTETSPPPLPKTPLKSDLETSVVEQITSVPKPTPVSAEVYEKEAKSEEITKHVEAAVETNIASNKPDISGLELLSNSIVEFENSRQSAETTPIKYEPQHELKNERHEDCIIATGDDVLKGIAHMTLKDRESDCPKSTPVDDTLGGLGLLCALAEQRFMEEVAEKQAEPEVKQQPAVVKEYKKERRREVSEERRKDKRRLKRCYEHGNESKIKRFKHDFDYDRRTEDEVINEREMEKIRENELELERERLSVLKRVAGERGLSEKGKRDLSYDLGITECDKRKTDKYRKDNDTKNNCSCKDERNNSKVYNKDTEKHNNNNNNNNGKIREWDMRQQLADLQRQCKEKQLELSKLTPKKSPECGDHFKKSSKPSKKQSPSPPPPLLDKMDTPPVIRHKGCPDLLKPPTLCAVIPTEDVKLPKCNVNLIKLTEVPIKTDIKFESPQKRKMSISHDSSDSTPEKISSSKKRKVGRPKKLMSAPGIRVATETIVAKKPRSKSSLVGYLLAAKNRLQMQNKNGLMYSKSSPPRYTEESPVTTPVKNKPKSHKASKNTVVSTNPPATEYKKAEHKASKIRPKLKAEPKIKTYTEEEDCASEWEITSQVEEEEVPQVPTPELEPVAPAAGAPQDTRCILTADHLSVDKLRVLTAMGGLFYAGQLTAIQAPDVYAITLDGERGNRPHIMSREEILRDAIVEVSPACTTELLPGTRLCAYWSQQYRCLYPGTVAEPGTPDPQLDMKFVCVEFDDGDSGRIALEDIRLLPADYPIIEYDPNPLLSLSKRRRRTSVNSVTEERRLNQTNTNTTPLASTPVVAVSGLPQEQPKSSSTPLAEKENTDMNRQSELDSHRERKRLKKRRKEKLKKLMCHEDKKKKRKHRCCDEHCKHRKHHKKHRKHKKHHHNRSENEEGTEIAEQQQQQPVVVVDEPEVTKNENSVEEEEEEDENVVPKKIEAKVKKSKKRKERRESVESRSKMAAFLPARQLWGWSGRGYKRVGVKGRARKQFFKAIQRGKESIMVGDCAVFLSTGRPDRPYIGKIEAMWESWGTNMVVRVKWFYHPEETVGCPLTLKYPGALFESPHVDENDVQTISHKCEVLPLKDYTDKLGPDLQRYETIYDNNDIYYLAGYYDPTTTTLTMQPGIPLAE